MASNEGSDNISQFTSTGGTENTTSADMVVNADVSDGVRGESWADTPLDVPSPDVLSHLEKNGICFASAPFWCGNLEKPKLVKNLSVVTSLQIIETFDAAGIHIDEITSIQWRALN